MLLALLGSLVLLFAPLGRSETPGGAVRTGSFVESEGWWILWLVLPPVVVTALPVLLERTRLRRAARIAAASLLAIGVALGSASIGILYLPAMIAMIVAGTLKDREVRAVSPTEAPPRPDPTRP